MWGESKNSKDPKGQKPTSNDVIKLATVTDMAAPKVLD